MTLVKTLVTVGLGIGLIVIALGFVNKNKENIQGSIANTKKGISDRLGLDKILNPFGFISEDQEKNIETFANNDAEFKTVTQPDPFALAQLKGNEAKESRKLREEKLTFDFPDLTFSTSLSGSQFSLGEQIKRDTGFKFEKFDRNTITKDSSRFEQTIAREQDRATIISRSLFGNVQNPNFAKGISSRASAKEIADLDQAHIRQQAIKEQLQLNKIQSEERIARGLILQETLGKTSNQQKESLKTFGLNINGGNALNPKALAKLQELGLLN